MAAYNQAIISPGAKYLADGSYSASDDRQLINDLFGMGPLSMGGGGFMPDVSNDCFIVAAGSGLSVTIASGTLIVPTAQAGNNFAEAIPGGGAYRVANNASRTVTCPAAHATNPRLDQVVCRVMDNEYDGSGFSEARFELIPGTATSGATFTNRNGAASLATLAESSQAVLLIADVLVPAAAVLLTSTDIKDRRVPLLMPKLRPVVTYQTLSPKLDDLNANIPLFNSVTPTYHNFYAYEVLYSLEESPLSLPGHFWRLMYSNTNGQVWSFLGGASLESEVATSQTTTSASYVDLSTVGPSITVPRAGIYDIQFGCDLNTSTDGTATFVSPKIGAAATADADALRNNNVQVASVHRTVRKTLAAGDAIKLQYKSNGTATLTAANRWLRITPVYIT